MSIGILLIGHYCFKADIQAVRMIGVLELILGMVILFVGLKSFMDKNPQIVMNENGIMDKRILKKIIPWNQLEKIELTMQNNQKVLKLNVSDKFSNDNFKWLYVKTAAIKLNQNPKTVMLNLDQLKFDSDLLISYLNSKNVDFVNEDIFRNLTGWNKILNKMLY
ncbi:hypothetical protein FEDK69T_05190 [Flavobacterium enshiense DK69]|uniref:Uncharacterized protein n=2 Tax=Flavobacterium TaxID=237 RepID=V6SKN2_9FLAO|nr:hypothetical protein FEDK69T_05190 [Flavobacterium enshiense DK69]KGO96600.1 hypothetical protein Q767_02460 [Flavobacterium enshiense DK69]